jgi:hypothetical protein
MAIQSMQLDPNAQAYTDDQIVGKVNTAAAQITRAGSIAAVARPIAAGEVDNTKLTATAAKANLDAMADVDRGYIQTKPVAGQFKVISIERDATGKAKVDYDDVAV